MNECRAQTLTRQEPAAVCSMKKKKNMMWRICFIPKEGRKRPKSFAAIRDTVVLYKAPKVTHVSSTCVKVLKHLK